MNIRYLTIAAGLALSFVASPALADGKVAWKPQAQAEAAAKAAGHEVRRSKVTEGNCYEVYTVKDGKNLELFYDPVSLKLVQTVVK